MRRPRTSTGSVGGENDRAFSSSSARAWARSAPTPAATAALSMLPELDPLVVLDLAEGAADDVGMSTGADQPALRLAAGEAQQRLGVAAHAGGEVVEAEQAGEGVGVGLLPLELGDEVELAVEQVLVAATHVHERVGDVAAQHGLLDGEVEGPLLHDVEGGGDVARPRPGSAPRSGSTSGMATSSPSGVSSTASPRPAAARRPWPRPGA